MAEYSNSVKGNLPSSTMTTCRSQSWNDLTRPPYESGIYWQTWVSSESSRWWWSRRLNRYRPCSSHLSSPSSFRRWACKCLSLDLCRLDWSCRAPSLSWSRWRSSRGTHQQCRRPGLRSRWRTWYSLLDPLHFGLLFRGVHCGVIDWSALIRSSLYQYLDYPARRGEWWYFVLRSWTWWRLIRSWARSGCTVTCRPWVSWRTLVVPHRLSRLGSTYYGCL